MRWMISALGTLLATTVVALLPAAVAPATASTGMPAPPFHLTTVDGKPVRLDDYRGKTLVLNVWGSWCPPCRLETPALIAEADAMRRAGVTFIGVDTTETAAVVRAYAAAKGVPYPQVATTMHSAFAHAYDITNFPTTFVIDPRGVLRAIHADNILPQAQLHAYIIAAQHGETAPLMSAEQTKLDALLAPTQFTFDGDSDSVLTNVRAAAKAISDADDELDDAMNDPARDHDLLKTHAEQNALRTRAIAALAPIAQTPVDRDLLTRMQGDAAAAVGDDAAAIRAYTAALAIDDHDRAALGGLAYALDRSGDAAGELATDERIATLYPSYGSEIAVARANAALGNHAATLVAIDAAIPLAAQHSPAALAWTHLYAGRAAVTIDDVARARREFRAAQSAAEHVPHGNPHFAWYLEQSQEALLALGLASAQPVTALTVAPWTGPELPGSVPSTYKYRVALSGPPGKTATLHASGLPKYWVASFCTDRVCAPFSVQLTIPPSGVKVIEFQVIPDGPNERAHPTVQIDATAGNVRSVIRTIV